MLTKQFSKVHETLDALKKQKHAFSFAQRETWYHLKGLTSFYEGRTKRAKAYFRFVFQYNPQARLPSDWILNPKVIALYEQVRHNTPLSTKLLEPRSAPQKKRTLSEVQAQTIRREMQQYRSSASFTGIVFLSNRPNTRIFINQLHVGNAGQNIPLKPGIYRFTIVSQGYSSVSRTYRIRPNHRPVIRVELADHTDDPLRRNQYELPHESWKSRQVGKNRIPSLKTQGKTEAYNWMPFGVGQFQNDEPKKAVIYSLFQGFGLTYGSYFYAKAKQSENILKRAELDHELVNLPSASEEGNANTDAGGSPGGGADGGGEGEGEGEGGGEGGGDDSAGSIWSFRRRMRLANEEQSTYTSEFNRYQAVASMHKTQLQQQQYIGFGIFAISWIGSIIDAYARYEVTEKRRSLLTFQSDPPSFWDRIEGRVVVWNHRQVGLNVKVIL